MKKRVLFNYISVVWIILMFGAAVYPQTTEFSYQGRNVNLQISTCSSSLRYKTNPALFTSGLNLVNQVQPITFDWKTGGMRDLGLGAEDAAAVEPLLVTYNEKGKVEGVKYDRVAVVLVNAVKEQQTQIQ